MKQTIIKFLSTLGVLNDDQKVSITNLAVYSFLFITAFKETFAGLTITNDLFKWKVESMDLASTLPLLFSLLNYHGKRIELNKIQTTTNESDSK